jgi:hypothetical protein
MDVSLKYFNENNAGTRIYNNVFHSTIIRPYEDKKASLMPQPSAISASPDADSTEQRR